MKTVIYLFVTFLAIKDSCKAGVSYKIEDTTKKVVDISVTSNVLTKGLNDITLSDLHKDTLYLVNKDKLVVIDMKSGIVSTNVKVNMFLAKQLKLNKYARQIVVQDNSYYISFLNELYSVPRDGEAFKVYTGYYFINDFEVLDNGILIATGDTIKTVTVKGKVLSSLPFEFSDAGFIQASKVISYSAVPEDYVYEFGLGKNSSVNLKKFAPISLTKVMGEPFISCSTNDYFVAFDYSKRNTVYVLKKDAKKNEIVKTIKLTGFNYTPTLTEIQKEEGNPNFKISYSNNTFYIIALVKGRLRVSSFIL
jgi:hypothetical protein